MLSRGRPETISPTAHYTGYVWARHNLGPAGLSTPEGRLLFHGLRPVNAVSQALGGPTIEGFLLARHRVIDHLLTAEIESGRVSQVLEIAAGMSPRGHVFAGEYGDRIDYVEADLAAMAGRKRDALERLGSLSSHHRVVSIDALTDVGPASLAAVTAELEPDRGIAVVTEGLLNYLSPDAVAGLWRRIAGLGERFSHVLYLSDLHLRGRSLSAGEQAFAVALGVFVQGRVHLHYRSEQEATAALHDAGFTQARLHTPSEFRTMLPDVDRPGAHRVRVIEARRGTSRPAQA